MIYDDAEMNVEVWAFTWADIIYNARVRLDFFSNQLKYQASRDSATEYLLKTHEKFIPKNFIDSTEDELAASKYIDK
ncbi:hypothetical protein L7G72_12850 [Xenorhabdus bovienii]|uniref:hypothetical protein n=1 Tax=Xenorhabdus bovienii TaxID=40576 RepID=UPI001EDE3DBE|nr:hypothetical protein [Xenorhabdus bovienii]MCG3462729.1 hypothetical protein [Xenorhabdus bovienii]